MSVTAERQLSPEVQEIVNLISTNIGQAESHPIDDSLQFTELEVGATSTQLGPNTGVGTDKYSDQVRDIVRLISSVEGDSGEYKADQRNLLKDSGLRVAKRLGVAAMVIVGAVPGAMVVDNIINSDDVARSDNEVSAEVTPTTLTTPTTDEVVPETTVTPPTTEIIEQIPEFKVGLNQHVGTLKIPSLCIEVDITSFSEEEDYTENQGTGTGSGSGTMDELELDVHPIDNCEIADEREAQLEAIWGRNFIDRNERVRDQYSGGDVSQWDPKAGYVMSAEGEYLSSLPGYSGNFVVAGHGSTFSAPFANFLLLEPGDTAQFVRADGEVFNYVMLERKVVDDQDYNEIFDYQNADYPNGTMTTFYCTGVQSGEPGTGASMRTVVRWAMVPEA
ncbi:sortase [Candidatus Saccharibacteria bacterium]|nr:sortase [Candidatus Saccharibacteria bacterium]